MRFGPVRFAHPPYRAAAGVAACSLVVGMAWPVQAQPGQAGLGETPAHKIVRLRGEAARVRRTIDRMNDQVEVVIERYDANREALARTQAAQAETERRTAGTERELAAARSQLDQRIWAIYTGDPPVGSLAGLLGAASLHQVLTTAKYQEGVVSADDAALARVQRAKRALDGLAAQLAAQRRAQEGLQGRLDEQRRQIAGQLATQRAYLARLGAAVRRAAEEQRRRQEELRRQAIARRMAALRAARLRAARARAAARLRAGRAGTARGAAAAHTGGRAASSPTRAAGRAVAFALAQLGKPYRWGATGPNTYDCSGLTQASYRHAGVAVPRVSAAQWYAGPHVSMAGLRPGDLVFFANDLGDPRTIHHVGMYIGRGLMVEAPFTGAVVRVSSIGRSDYIGAVRPTG